jgi:hypothetical protein|tara:strand:+ start:403 stop:777 length:375 start_codon:yes stop_codon:yes gene_type:complete
LQDQAASANVGRAGEYLALSRLSLAGYFCTLAPSQDHDGYIQTDTRIVTLQVKTSSKIRHWKYQFYTKHGEGRQRSDVYAFVALDLDAIFFCRGNDPIIRATSTHLGADLFDQRTMHKVLSSFD